MTDENIYHTKDLALAAYFYSLKVKFLGVKDSGNNFYWFLFFGKSECENLERKFWAKEALVDAQTFMDSLRNLKQQVFYPR